MTARRPRVLVYADVDLNVIDGSAVWAVSAVECLARAGAEVTFALKAAVRTERLLLPLLELPGVRVVRPWEQRLVADRTDQRLDAAEAARLLVELDAQAPFDLLLLRGINVFDPVLDSGAFDGRLWSYLTEPPQSVATLTHRWREQLGRIALASRLLLCQTEELRCLWEGVVPAASGRSAVFPPIVPVTEATEGAEAAEARPLARAAGGLGNEPIGTVGRPLRLVYTGKFAPDWRTLEMTELPAQLAEKGVTAELHVVGDKIHADPSDPTWRRRMQEALQTAPGVVWHGGVSRAEAMAIASGSDVGLSWRSPRLDASIELSTKVLEFGSVGVPVLVSPTPLHQRLLGADYPLFASSQDEVLSVLVAACEPRLWQRAAGRCRELATEFEMPQAIARTRALLDRSLSQDLLSAGSTAGGPSTRVRLAAAGHDLKFLEQILGGLQVSAPVEIRRDQWTGLGEHDEAQSRETAAWADVVIAEWCGPVAVWYSRHKRAGQRLVVRLHRFELDSPYPAQVLIDNVDAVVCVDEHYRQLTLAATGWPPDKVVTIGNAVVVDELDRPKLPHAELAIGMIGSTPQRKRLDLALDILQRLRGEDRRFRLLVKSKHPWDYWWIWKQPAERRYAEEQLRRIAAEPLLRDGVVFEPFGNDVAAWLRLVGHVVSTSDDESFHLAPAEGMASGATPVILPWPGAETVYASEWIVPDAGAAAAAILRRVHDGTWQADAERAKEQVRRDFDLPVIVGQWWRLLDPAAAAATGAPRAAR